LQLEVLLLNKFDWDDATEEEQIENMFLLAECETKMEKWGDAFEWWARYENDIHMLHCMQISTSNMLSGFSSS